MKVEFSQDNYLRVIATTEDGGSIKSQSVEALLMLAILEKLEEMWPSCDVETAIEEV